AAGGGNPGVTGGSWLKFRPFPVCKRFIVLLRSSTAPNKQENRENAPQQRQCPIPASKSVISMRFHTTKTHNSHPVG
ncbi:MAG: hypothetical protein WBN88_18255, partial [Anderseniella sp.]